MAVGDNNGKNGQGKKASRRSWTRNEEEALLNILDDVVARGCRCDNGNFKAGTMVIIEKALKEACPESGLKANPHLESKLRKWKKQYGIVFDMVNNNGFEWNDIKQCVEAQSHEVWQCYVQNNKEADKWISKPFPLFGRLGNIFGKNSVIEKEANPPPNMIEDIDRNVNRDVVQRDESSPRSVNQTATTQQTIQSQHNCRKRTREHENFTTGLLDVVGSLCKMFEKTYEQMQLLTDRLGCSVGENGKNSNDYKYVAGELQKMGLSHDNQIDAMTLMVEKPQKVQVFRALDGEIRKAYVMKILGKTACK